MRLLMLGTGPFAVPTFRGLFSTHHEILALVTAPLRAARVRQAAPRSFLRDIAQEHGASIYDPEDINSPEAQIQLQRYGADLMVVCDYGQILSAQTLATARRGGINIHASLLPRYRGAAPINWAIYHGEQETGVTVIRMTPQVDAGPCIAQVPSPIAPEETAVEVEARLSELGARLVRQTLDDLEAGRQEALPQDPALASSAPRLKKTDGLVDWTRPAQAIENQIRALQPWPKTYTFWPRPKGPPLRLILGPVIVLDTFSESALPGTVLEAEGPRLVIATGQGAVLPKTIQPAGKRVLSVEEFLRGYRVQVGDQFGSETVDSRQ